MVAEMLPLDAERRAECAVWLAFTAREEHRVTDVVAAHLDDLTAEARR